MNQKVFSIFIVYLFLNQFALAQKIEPGKYLSVYDYSPTTGKFIPFGEYSHKITIIDERTFIYVKDYCGEVEFGFGQYKIVNNPKRMMFEFSQIPDSIQILPYKIKNIEETKIDSTIFYIQVLYENKPVEYSRIFYTSKVHKNVFKSFQTDTGVTRILIKKSDIPLTFEIGYVGYGKVSFAIEDSLSKEIFVNLDSPNKVSVPGTKLTSRLKEIGKDGFYIKGEFWKDWTFFKKVK